MTAGITMNFETIEASASPEVPNNENWESIDFGAVYSVRQEVTSGTTWGYRGGRWGGFARSAGTHTLTNAATNYIVVQRSNGDPSVSTTSANWDNVLAYARVYKVTMAGGVVTAVEDHRAGPNGIFGAITGAAAELRGLTFTSDTDSTADSDPGAGLFKWNNATQGSATVLYFDDQTADGVSLTTLWGSLGEVGMISLQQGDDASRWQLWKWTALPVDGTGYRKFTVTLQATSASAIQDNKLVLSDFETSLPGAVVGPSSATDNAIARFDGTTGKLVQNSVVTISDLGAIAGAISVSIAQGTITDPANAFTVSSTWNDAADTFVGTSIDITDTASAAASLIARWRVGGSEIVSFRKDGLITTAGDLAVNGGDLTSSQTTFNLLNATVTTLNIGSAATTVRIGATASSFGFAAITSALSKFNFGGTFTSSGAGSTAVGLFFNTDITGASGDTTYLTYFTNIGSITTQGASDTIAVVATMRLAEPTITVGAGDTITLASTLHIASVPTEGVTNAALSIAAGNFITAGNAHIGSITLAPAGNLDVSSATGGVLTLRRIDTSVTANDMVGKLQFYAADTSTTSNFIGAEIEAQATNTIATDINPMRLIVRTTGTGVAATPTQRWEWDQLGNAIIGTAAIATNATDGFLYVPSCAGTPTGVPTTYTGRVPIVVDTTNNKLYFYSGAWRDAGP